MSARLGALGRTSVDRLLATAVFAISFLIRWITLRFDNDYFMHVAWAAQMRHGEWPVRDFVEPGFILQTLLSYGGFVVGGNQLVAEATIACGFIAAGATCVYLTVRRCGGGRTIALCAAAIAILAYPRAYAYPKAFLYPATALAIAVHAVAPGRRTLTPMAVLTAVAFLFRHDHALWIAAACGVAIFVEYGRTPRTLVRAVGRCTAIASAIVAPWLLWVALSGHVVEFLDNLSAAGSGMTSWRIPEAPPTIDRSAPLIGWAPVRYPQIAIRWSSSLPSGGRADKERQYGLQSVSGSDHLYELTNITASNIRTLISDPVIEDTNYVNRVTMQLRGGWLITSWVWVQEHVPPVRMRIAGAVFNAENALPLLNWLTFLTPWGVVAMGLVDAGWLRRGERTGQWPWSVVVALAFLGIAGYQGLVRGSPDSRLGDVASITGISLAYVASTLWLVRWPFRTVTGPLAAATLIGAIVAAGWYGQRYGRLSDIELATVTELDEQVAWTVGIYNRPPLDTYAGPEETGLARVARWLHVCTPEQSHVALVGFEPQVFVQSERPFAAGLAFMYEGFSSSERNQRLALKRWARQNVPVVIVVDSTWEEFSRDYPLLRQWIDEHYRVVARSRFDDKKPLTVWINTAARVDRMQAETGLPCLR